MLLAYFVYLLGLGNYVFDLFSGQPLDYAKYTFIIAMAVFSAVTAKSGGKR